MIASKLVLQLPGTFNRVLMVSLASTRAKLITQPGPRGAPGPCNCMHAHAQLILILVLGPFTGPVHWLGVHECSTFNARH